VTTNKRNVKRAGAKPAGENPAGHNSKPPLPKLDRAPMYELLETLKRAFSSVDVYVAENRKASEDARNAGKDWLAKDVFDPSAERHAAATTPEFQRAAWLLVSLVYEALGSGNTGHVLALGADPRTTKRSPLNKRLRRRWLERCESSLRLARIMRSEVTVSLPVELRPLDERASHLTPEVVAKILDGEPETAELFAAKLACSCGAFDYGPRDQKKAKLAFMGVSAARGGARKRKGPAG
jgi:hypothetical protein